MDGEGGVWFVSVILITFYLTCFVAVVSGILFSPNSKAFYLHLELHKNALDSNSCVECVFCPYIGPTLKTMGK